MEELIGQVIGVVRQMWRFRWYGLIAAWAVGLLGSVGILLIPNKYEASARIYVDTQSILKPLMAGMTVQPNVEQQVNMLSRTLISRPNIEKLVRMADLDLKSTSKTSADELIDRLTAAIEVRSTAKDNLYSLAYKDNDKEKAKRVVQSLVSIFVESSLGASRRDTDSAKAFINEQIKSYETKLEDAERKVKEFKLRNIEMQSPDGKDASSKLVEVSALLEQAKLQLREAENARDAARAQMNAEKSPQAGGATASLLQESAVSIATPEIDSRLEAMRRNLDQLLQRYTEQHPDVVSTRQLIKSLEDQRRKEVAEARKAALSVPQVSGGQNNSLAYQELSRALANAEVQIASLKARVAEYSSRYAQAKTMIKTSPQIEAEAAQLNRDYVIIKKNYEDLVARRQSAMMSGELDVASGIADFRLIDPPRVAPQPVSPNRPMLMAGAHLGALMIGLMVAFAATQLRPVFTTASDLREKSGLPVLGVVSMIVADEQARKERVNLYRFLGGLGALVLLFFSVYGVMFFMASRA